MTKSFTALAAACLFSLAAHASAQTLADDFRIVREILDSNGLGDLPVEECIVQGADCRLGSPCVQRIVELKLSNRGLRTIPAAIGRLDGLFFLRIDNNSLTTLPAEIGQLSLLRSLWAQHNELTALPQKLAQCTSLTELIIDQNPFQTLPEVVGQMGVLRSLRINSRLSRFPLGLGSFTSLEEIDFDNNRVDSLPDEIGNITSLKRLSMRGCGLAWVSPRVGRLPFLQELDLRDNALTEFPECDSLPKLRRLMLAKNKLDACPSTLGLTASLMYLDLSGNMLTSLPGRFGMLDSLQVLLLNENQLAGIGPIPLLRTLKRLNLSHNRITSFPDDIGNLTQLEQLDLRGNGLISLPVSITRITRIAPRSDPVSSRVPIDTIWNLDLGENCLCGLDTLVAAWADFYDRDWRITQNCLSEPSPFAAWEACQRNFLINYPYPRQQRITALFVTKSGAVYAGTEDSHVFRSLDAGTSWADVSGAIFSAEAARVSCFAQDSAGIVYAGTQSVSGSAGNVFFIDKNDNWMSFGSLPAVTALIVTPDNELISGTRSGIHLLQSNRTWEAATIDLDSIMPFKPYVFYFTMIPGGSLMAQAGYGCAMWLCRDYLLMRTGENAWRHDTTQAAASFIAPAVMPNGTVFSVAGNAIVQRSASGSESIATTDMLAPVTELAVSPHGWLFTINAGGLMYVRNSTSWTRFDYGLPAEGAAALAFDAVGNVFAATAKGVYINRSFASANRLIASANANRTNVAAALVMSRHGVDLIVARPAETTAAVMNLQGRIVHRTPQRRYEAGRYSLMGRSLFPGGVYIITADSRDTKIGGVSSLRIRAVIAENH